MEGMIYSVALIATLGLTLSISALVDNHQLRKEVRRLRRLVTPLDTEE